MKPRYQEESSRHYNTSTDKFRQNFILLLGTEQKKKACGLRSHFLADRNSSMKSLNKLKNELNLGRLFNN